MLAPIPTQPVAVEIEATNSRTENVPESSSISPKRNTILSAPYLTSLEQIHACDATFGGKSVDSTSEMGL